MNSLYKKVEKEQKNFYLKRKVKDFFRNTFGVIKLIILLIVIGAACWWVIPRLKQIPAFVAEKVGMGETKPEDAASSPPAAPVDPMNPGITP
jgi:hypothetical protein